MIVIGLGHRARAGKDSVAEHLVAKHGFKRYALADLLKKSISLVTGWDDRHMYGELKEVVDPYWGISPRAAFQLIGTEGYRRIFGADVWAKALRLQIEREGHQRVVIADVRFREGEVPMVQQLEGLLWKVDRPGLPALVIPPTSTLKRFRDLVTGRKRKWSHQSEWDLVDFADWDAVIHNDQTLPLLYQAVDELLAKQVDLDLNVRRVGYQKFGLE